MSYASRLERSPHLACVAALLAAGAGCRRAGLYLWAPCALDCPGKA